MNTVLLIAAMWWRWADGSNKIFDGRKVHIWSGLGMVLAYAAAYVGLGDPLLALPPAAIASWSIIASNKKFGCEGWSDTNGMMIRYGLPGAVIIIYMLALWILGRSDLSIGWPIYFLLQLQIAYAYKLQIEEAARAFVGAAIIGGLVVL